MTKSKEYCIQLDVRRAYVIVVISESVIPIEALRMYIRETKNVEVKHLLEIVIEWIVDVEYDMKFNSI